MKESKQPQKERWKAENENRYKRYRHNGEGHGRAMRKGQMIGVTKEIDDQTQQELSIRQ